MTDFRKPKQNSYGVMKVQPEHREGSKLELFSQNFCDKRTWFTTSVRHTGVTMVDSGDGYRFTLPDGPKIIVDVCHGRVSEGHKLKADYVQKVYVDGVEKEEHHPDDCMYFDATGAEVHNFDDGYGDFGLDYLTGDVFFKEYQGGKTVTIDYSEVVDSKWYITPSAGKRIELLSAELQFSRNSRMNSDFVFQARGDVGKHPLLAPYLDVATNSARSDLGYSMTWNGTTTVTTSDTTGLSVGEFISPDGYGTYYYVGAVIPNTAVVIADVLNIGFIPTGTLPSVKSSIALFPSGTMLPLGDATRYQTKFDIVAEANISYPIIPADEEMPGGGWSWRQSPFPLEIFRWDYKDQAYIDVRDEWGMDVEISLGNDIPASGWRAVVTFYGLSEDEV